MNAAECVSKKKRDPRKENLEYIPLPQVHVIGSALKNQPLPGVYKFATAIIEYLPTF